MKRLALTLLTVLSSAAAQLSGSRLAQDLKLPDGSYTLVTTLPHLGVSVPEGAVQLRDLRPVRSLSAATLRYLQEQMPPIFGYRCVAPLQLVLAPVDGLNSRAEQTRWMREARAQILADNGLKTVFLAGATGSPVLVQVQYTPGFLVAAACPAEVVPGLAPALRPIFEWADPVVSVGFSLTGVLTWCAPGRPEPLRTVRAYQGAAQFITRSVDGRQLATIGFDGAPRLKVWAAQDGHLISSAALPAVPTRVHFTADSRLIFTGGPSSEERGGQLVTWYDAASGREAGRLGLPTGESFKAVSGDGRRIVTFGGNRSGTLRLRELPSGRQVFSVPGTSNWDVAFARGDAWIAAADPAAGRLNAWRTLDGQRLAVAQTGLRGLTYVQPGLTPGSVLILVVDGTSPSAAGRSTLLGWTGTPTAPVTQQTVERDGRALPVVDARSGQLQLVPRCAQ